MSDAAAPAVPSPAVPGVAAVIIGRNEGERLLRCLVSLRNAGAAPIIYVDSGSTDGSAQAAADQGAQVVQLDLAQPFTAARARNAGIDAIRVAFPAMDPAGPAYIQFVDGDCELQPGWITTARDFLEAHPEAAIACGRRRERFPEATAYNRLCDREWDTPVGRALACGGDALIRRRALDEVGGYNPSLIAGEEPEMCVRLRARGWQIWRLDAEMTLHDAAMTRFGQFWKRARRAGHAWAEGAALHGRPPERHGVSESRRALIWGLALPAAILGLALLGGAGWLLLLLIYPLQVLRLSRRLSRDRPSREAREQALLLTLSKFAEAAGVVEYHWRRWAGRPSVIIEYK